MKLGMAYYGAFLPEHLRADLSAMRGMGCDEVLITLAENDFHIFPGKVRSAPGISHDLGLRIVANLWGFACAFGGGRVSRLLTDNPDVWQVRRDGTRKGEGCMNHPALRRRAEELVEMCAGLGYDAYFWDEPTVQDCYCKHCRAAFATGGGGDLSAAGPHEVHAFRQASIASYVEDMSAFVKRLDARFETATCVMPTDEPAWEVTARIAALDTFGTDPYWECFGQDMRWVSEKTRAAVELSRRYGKRSLMWLQAWRMPAGREAEIEAAARAIAAEGPDAIYAWGFRAGEGTNEACEDPAAAWAAVVRAYRELSQGAAR